MADAGGQLLALDVITPTQVQAGQAQADALQAESQLARATMPAKITAANETATGLGLENQSRSIANQSANLTLQQQLQLNAYRQHLLQQQAGSSYQADSPEQGQAQDGAQLPGSGNASATSQLASTAAATGPVLPSLFDPRVQQVMQSIDPNDPKAALKFDTQMRALAEEVPQANQFVGQYSNANIRNWRAAIGSHGIANMPAPQLGGASTPTASPLAALATPASAGAPANDTGAPAAPATPPSPLGADGDKYLMGMSILDPKGTGEMLAMQGMIKYQQTGDLSVLARYSPDMYEKITSAQKNLSDAQKTAVATQFGTMGQAANAVLQLAAKYGNDAPEVRAAYNQSITDAEKQGWINPQIAQRELSQPIDFAQLAYTATRAQTVTEALTTSGQAAANEARAKNANLPVHTEAVPGVVDANGYPMFYNSNAPPPGGFTGAPGGNPRGSGAASTSLNGFVDTLTGGESSNNPNAQNPRSSAHGLGQFVDDTWRRTIAANRPDLVGGKTADQIKADPTLNAQVLAMRADGNLSREMVTDLAQSNGAALQQMKVPVTGATLGAAHILGIGDFTKVLHSAPGTPLSQIVSPQAMAANPQFNGQTAGGFVATMAQKFGNNPISLTGDDAAPQTGKDYLATLPVGMQNQVQAVMDGRLVLPNTGRMSPLQQQVLQNVMKVDPTFDFVNAPARAATRKDFTSGKSAQAITAYNTAIGHLDQMDQAITGLGNTPFTWWNKPAQWLGQNVGDPHTQAAISNFNTVKGAVTSELVKALRGTGGAEADIQYWQRQFDTADSPVALHTAVQEASHLLGSRIDAMTEQYNTGMGTAAKYPPGLTPTAARQLQRLQNGGAQTASAGPVTATGPNGQKVQWNGQAWVALQ